MIHDGRRDLISFSQRIKLDYDNYLPFLSSAIRLFSKLNAEFGAISSTFPLAHEYRSYLFSLVKRSDASEGFDTSGSSASSGPLHRGQIRAVSRQPQRHAPYRK